MGAIITPEKKPLHTMTTSVALPMQVYSTTTSSPSQSQSNSSSSFRQWQRLLQTFSAKLILEVMGGAGAVWGFSEVVGLRNESNWWFWRPVAKMIGLIFLARWSLQLRSKIREVLDSSSSGGRRRRRRRSTDDDDDGLDPLGDHELMLHHQEIGYGTPSPSTNLRKNKTPSTRSTVSSYEFSRTSSYDRRQDFIDERRQLFPEEEEGAEDEQQDEEEDEPVV